VIVRIWRGQTTIENADAYFRHVTEAVFPALAGIHGHRGAYLLRRETDRGIEFLAVTLWESVEAIREFAGKDVETAVVEPRARAVLAEFDSFVRHYDVVHGADCGGTRHMVERS
jgi:heme-degrading monooxygenase HmoA